MFTVIVNKLTGFTDREVQGMTMLAGLQRGRGANFFADTMRATGMYSVIPTRFPHK